MSQVLVMNNWTKAIVILKNDGVVVLPTDTIYGVVGSALSKRAVERIYKVRGRDKGKPCIVLISSYSQLQDFGVSLDQKQSTLLGAVWPGKVSVVMPCISKQFSYLHRGTKTIAFRMVGPQNKNLYTLLQNIGPLVAPSANPQGLVPARNITEARKYFHERVDMYINGGTKESKASTLIEFQHETVKILRQGAVEITV